MCILLNMILNGICSAWLILDISFSSISMCLKEAVPAPWLALITIQQQGLVCADLCSVQQ